MARRQSLADVAREHITLDLARQREDNGTPSIVLRRELDVQVRHRLKDGTAEGVAIRGRRMRRGASGVNSKVTYRIDWMVLEKMISLYESRSCSLYPPWWMSFICLRTVDCCTREGGKESYMLKWTKN